MRTHRYMANLTEIVAIVDDDESIGRAIKRLLRVLGMEAETFSSGEEFLDRLSSSASYPPACVVMDLQMPGINGLELLRRLSPTRVSGNLHHRASQSRCSRASSRVRRHRLFPKTIQWRQSGRGRGDGASWYADSRGAHYHLVAAGLLLPVSQPHKRRTRPSRVGCVMPFA
jgi:hypothetical protein